MLPKGVITVFSDKDKAIKSYNYHTKTEMTEKIRELITSLPSGSYIQIYPEPTEEPKQISRPPAKYDNIPTYIYDK